MGIFELNQNIYTNLKLHEKYFKNNNEFKLIFKNKTIINKFLIILFQNLLKDYTIVEININFDILTQLNQFQKLIYGYEIENNLQNVNFF